MRLPMRTITTAIIALLLATATPAIATEETVDVSLEVTIAGLDHKGCDLTLAADSTVADLLDAAVEAECISEWSYESYEGYGRYVTSIDGIPAHVVTYWAFYVDGGFAETGIDHTILADGATYTFNYEQWVVPTTL